MSRIPLPQPMGQSLLQGLMTGSQIGRARAMSQYFQTQNALLPSKLQAAQDAHQEALLQTNPQDALAYKGAVFRGFLNMLNGGQPSSTNMSAQNPNDVTNGSPSNSQFNGNQNIGITNGQPTVQNNGNQSINSPTQQVTQNGLQQQPTNNGQSSGLPLNLSPQVVMAARAAGFNLPMITPQQQAQLDIQKAHQIAQNAVQTNLQQTQNVANVKKGQAGLAAFNNSMQLDNTINGIDNITKTDPQIFSWIMSGINKRMASGQQGKDVGYIDAQAGPLIASMVKNISTSHGGIGVVNQVKGMKPGYDRSVEVAQGNIAGIRDQNLQNKVYGLTVFHSAYGRWPTETEAPGSIPYIAYAQNMLKTNKAPTYTDFNNFTNPNNQNAQQNGQQTSPQNTGSNYVPPSINKTQNSKLPTPSGKFSPYQLSQLHAGKILTGSDGYNYRINPATGKLEWSNP